MPRAPGTFGSLLGVLVTLACKLYFPHLGWEFLLALFVFSFFHIHFYERGSSIHDDQRVVIDEVCGQMLCLWFVKMDLWIYLAGFCLFRLLDIRKPWLIGWVDRHVPGAWGTFLDDLLAGGVAGVILYASLWAFA